MGNWHCISSSCAEVHYRSYLPPSIRYRYPDEKWQYVDGDDYSLEQEIGKSNGVYQVTGIRARNGVNYCEIPPQVTTQWGFSTRGPIHGLKEQYIRTDDRYSCPDYKRIVGKADVFLAYLSAGINPANSSLSIISFYRPHQLKEVVKITGIERIDGQIDENNCIFTITKNDEVVHQETRMGCPEVEKLPCRLSDERKVIEIKKLPYLEKVEVVPYQYSAYRLPGVPSPIAQADPIPDECLNIYKNAIYVIPPPIDALKDSDAIAFDSLIEQICSPPGCPPPEYTVICNCECRECPPNTCAVTCDGHICCYDTITGKSIEQIEFSDYCGSAV